MKVAGGKWDAVAGEGGHKLFCHLAGGAGGWPFENTTNLFLHHD